MKLLELIKKNQKLITTSLAASTVILAGSLPLVSNSSYNKGHITGYNDGVSEGIVQGRVGYVKGYDGGLVAVEGYDGRGWDYNCENSTWVFRADQIENLKAKNQYDYGTIKKVFPKFADSYKHEAEAVCRSLGYQP